MSLLQPILDNRTQFKQLTAAYLYRSRTAGYRSNLTGIGILMLVNFLLPGFFLLPFALVWGTEIAQYDIVASTTFILTTSVVVYGYLTAIGRSPRDLCAGKVNRRMVLSSLAGGLAFVGAGELLWGVTIHQGMTITAPRFDPVSNFVTPPLFFGVVILTPLVKEAFYRGVVQDHAGASLSTGGAILVSASMFTVFHTWNFYNPAGTSILPTMAFVFSQGLLLGYLYWRHRTIVAPAIAHAMVNLYAFTAVFA